MGMWTTSQALLFGSADVLACVNIFAERCSLGRLIAQFGTLFGALFGTLFGTLFGAQSGAQIAATAPPADSKLAKGRLT